MGKGVRESLYDSKAEDSPLHAVPSIEGISKVLGKIHDSEAPGEAPLFCLVGEL